MNKEYKDWNIQHQKRSAGFERSLYLDCSGGISGDMAVGAMLDLGADRRSLQKALDSIPDKGFSVEISRVKKSAIDCCDFNVILDQAHENHDHDVNYLYGTFPDQDADRENSSSPVQGAGADSGMAREDESRHHHGHHAHRTWAEVRKILAGVDMSDHARIIAEKIFEILAQAEAKAHGVPADEVHFHEVGAIDSIVDIVSAAVCLDSLDVSGVVVSPLTEGTGTVRTQHGRLPIPVPAVANIAASYGLNMRITDVRGEYVTPTGAAFAAAVRTADRLPESFRILKTGYGSGKREQELHGFLRAMLIQEEPDGSAENLTDQRDDAYPGRIEGEDRDLGESGTGCSGDFVCKLETNIDDSTGEELGYVMDRLFAAGARDVHYIPVYMKKNRPGWQLNVICDENQKEKLEDIIFRETTTIGIRELRVRRRCLNRSADTVGTEYGSVAVKKVMEGELEKVYPEYSSVAEMAEKNGVSFRTVFRAAEEAAEKAR